MAPGSFKARGLEGQQLYMMSDYLEDQNHLDVIYCYSQIHLDRLLATLFLMDESERANHPGAKINK